MTVVKRLMSDLNGDEHFEVTELDAGVLWLGYENVSISFPKSKTRELIKILELSEL